MNHNKNAKTNERAERLAAALRENLRKRKAQDRTAPVEKSLKVDETP